MLKNSKILDIPITSSSRNDILKYIITGLQKRDKKIFIATPNPEMLVACYRDPRLKTLLNSAEVSLPDGMGVVWASKILQRSVQARVSGVDLMVDLCQKCAEQGLTVGFLGGWRNVAEKTANCLKKKFPELKVGFIGEEWTQEGFISDLDDRKLKGEGGALKTENRRSTNILPTTIKNPSHDPMSRIDLLFVAFGFPKQEQWIYDNLEKIPVQAAMGVGGAFDYLSGNVRRAPRWVQNIGFEWLFRLIRQPWRFRRQAALIEFIWFVLKEKFSG